MMMESSSLLFFFLTLSLLVGSGSCHSGVVMRAKATKAIRDDDGVVTTDRSNNAVGSSNPPVPSANQQRALDVGGFAMFIHYSVDPWTDPHTEHNCVGKSPKCIPATAFNPTNLSTDAWVEAAVAMGASEICLTAHHEGGFCLWDTKYTNYSVMHSPYGKDIVQQFVESCKKYNVQPCYYMGPNANGYLSNKLKLPAEEFIRLQLGMLSELLTNYDLKPSRLWWDHWLNGCGGLAPCPHGSFPDGWIRFVDLVRKLSPDTLICPGPDCDGHQGESGFGKYPTWYPCSFDADKNGLSCKSHGPQANRTGFHPYEACATMVTRGNWFCWGDGSKQTYWTAGQIWNHYMNSVGIGWINTLNAPVCTTGQMNPTLVKEMTIFGNALRSLMTTVIVSEGDIVGNTCQNTTLVTLTIPSSSSATFNAAILKEDLSKGQRITKYALEYQPKDGDDDSSSWIPFPNQQKGKGGGVHGQSIGNLLIDFLDKEVAAKAGKVRLVCIEAMATPVYLTSVSLNMGAPPEGSDDWDEEDDATTAAAVA